MPSARPREVQPLAHVASLLLPALVAGPLKKLAERVAQADGHPERAARVQRTLQALTGRLLAPGGWTAGTRNAGAEPLCTGRAHPYEESSLRKAARAFSASGAVGFTERLLEQQVHRAVGKKEVTAYTDLFDQVYWTKKPAHAGPIGGLGNRLLAATYFGLTFVQSARGPNLAYHVSWHKPASPLFVGLQALHAERTRSAWLTQHVTLHALDRGTQGDPTLRWALDHGIPYLTPAKDAVRWRRYRQPTHHTPSGVPIFERADDRLKKVTVLPETKAVAPRIIVFPARPEKGQQDGRAIVYRTAAAVSDEQIQALDEVYKARWPNNENPIKALKAVGFGVNRDRTLERTTSSGQDVAKARVEEKIRELDGQMQKHVPAQDHLLVPNEWRAFLTLLKKRRGQEKKRKKLEAEPVTKGARSNRGGEMLCKGLTLLLYNALALVLWRSPLAEVQRMTAARVGELLLHRATLVNVAEGRMTMWVEAMADPLDQRHQEELVRLMNDARLENRGAPIRFHIRDPALKMQALRVVA